MYHPPQAWTGESDRAAAPAAWAPARYRSLEAFHSRGQYAGARAARRFAARGADPRHRFYRVPRCRLGSGQGGRDSGELFVWDVQRGERVRTFAGLRGVVYAVTWGPSGELLVSGGSDGMLRWWDVQRGECVRIREAHQGAIRSLRITPDGRRLASCGDDGAIMLWDLISAEHLRTLRRDRPYERLNITRIRGLTEAQKATLLALGAIEEITEAIPK